MSAPQQARSYASWPVPGTAFTIECSPTVIEQLRAAACGGLRQLSRGGLEVGGILLGQQNPNGIRILGWRPVSCEHAQGPAFLLTDKDRAELAKQLLSLNEESSSTGSLPLGWWISHTRTPADLTARDRETYQQFFPESWQVTLVIHPVRDSTAEASFFIRGADGQTHCVPEKPFTLSPTHSPAMVSATASPLVSGSSAHPPRLIRPSNGLRSHGDPAHWRRAAARRALFDRRLWIWLVPALLGLIVLSMIVDRGKPGLKPTSFGFRASEVGGKLRLEWDRNAETVREATWATLHIRDGQTIVPIGLDADRLRQGFYDYANESGDLEIRMTLSPPAGEPIQEFTKYVGAPGLRGASPAEAAALRGERDVLRQEVHDLRETLRKETARNAQLQDVVRILEQRVGITKPQPAK